jgi:hypothetical protein
VESTQGKGGRVEDSPEEGNRRVEIPVKIREVPRTVRSWRRCVEDNP